jgi:hypothetical protein
VVGRQGKEGGRRKSKKGEKEKEKETEIIK